MSLVNGYNEEDKLSVWIDASYITYHSIFGAVKKFKDTSIHASILQPPKETNQDDLPILTTFSDYTKILEDEFLKKVANTRSIVKKVKEETDIGLTNSDQYYFCQDCSNDNWRKSIFPDYKGQRKTVPKEFDVRDAFRYVTDIIMPKICFDEYMEMTTLQLDDFEGDDLISQSILSKPNQKHIMIATDTDFNQLHSDTVIQYNLEFKRVNIKPEKFGFDEMNPKQYLLCKILSGDKSDNIGNVFTRCGEKTAGKLIKDIDLLKSKLNEDQACLDQFKLNTRLIDFSKIPKSKLKPLLEYLNEHTSQ